MDLMAVLIGTLALLALVGVVKVLDGVGRRSAYKDNKR